MNLKRLYNKAIDALDGFFAYVLTVIGILASNYLPDLSSKGKIDFEADLWRVGLSMIVAFILVAKQETGGDAAGKRANFWSRMGNALAHGVCWASLINAAGGK